MYEFTDTTIQECNYDKNMPISAMNYNGIFLEDYIEGYETLYVDGREMINLEISADNMKYGSKVNYHRFPPRILTITYKMVNDDPYQLMVEYRKLMNTLYKKDKVNIWFNDELDVYYEGMYQSCSGPPGNTTSIVSSFQIYCESPLKKTVKTFITERFIGAETPLDTFPLEIKCIPNNNNQIKITNSKETIILRADTTKANDVIVFDFVKNSVLVNGYDRTNILDLRSDFEFFRLEQGSEIICENAKLEIKYKGVTL